MSITFSAAAAHTADFGTYYTTADDSPELGMSNRNGATILTLLGFTHEEDYYGGVVDSTDFLGRVLVAQATLDVATDDEHGKPTVIDGNFNFIDCGTPPGYLADRLAILHEVATWAQQRHLKVVWA